MAIKFYKYQGTGNDFVIIDDREHAAFPGGEPQREQLAFLCNRHFGIGADGLILLRHSEEYDFTMKYFNSDGVEGSMCGNGGRCVVAFARQLSITGNETVFNAVDGLHRARLLASDGKQSMVSLQLHDVALPEPASEDLVIDTGSPHLVIFSSQIDQINVAEEGRLIRLSEPYAKTGINVNFVEALGDDTLFVRTYERGVEQETLSCGTGVTAASLAAWLNNIRNIGNMYNIKTMGGTLKVSFTPPADNKALFTGIWLTGPASFVFDGEITIP